MPKCYSLMEGWCCKVGSCLIATSLFISIFTLIAISISIVVLSIRVSHFGMIITISTCVVLFLIVVHLNVLS